MSVGQGTWGVANPQDLAVRSQYWVKKEKIRWTKNEEEEREIKAGNTIKYNRKSSPDTGGKNQKSQKPVDGR